MINRPLPWGWDEWPDKNDFIVHLTKNDAPGEGFPGILENYPAGLGVVPARERLENILRTNRIYASHLRHMALLDPVPIAVAFSEAMPETVHNLAGGSYSGWGIIIHKYNAFIMNGGPVWYLNNELFKAFTGDPENIHAELLEIAPASRFLLAPYAPPWQNQVRFHANRQGRRNPCDWTHEREWRVPADFVLPFQEDGRPDFGILVPDEAGIQTVLDLGLQGIEQDDIITLEQYRAHGPVPLLTE